LGQCVALPSLFLFSFSLFHGPVGYLVSRRRAKHQKECFGMAVPLFFFPFFPPFSPPSPYESDRRVWERGAIRFPPKGWGDSNDRIVVGRLSFPFFSRPLILERAAPLSSADLLFRAIYVIQRLPGPLLFLLLFFSSLAARHSFFDPSDSEIEVRGEGLLFSFFSLSFLFSSFLCDGGAYTHTPDWGKR